MTGVLDLTTDGLSLMSASLKLLGRGSWKDLLSAW